MTVTEFTYQEKKCLRCGKQFIVQDPDEYVFKRQVHGGNRYFCSWGCLRLWDAQRGTKSERREKMIQAIKDGLTVNEIAELLQIDKTTIVYWKNKLEKEEKD